jgi:hypothetical protein
MSLTDPQLIEAVKTYMASHKLVTRGELRRKFNTSLERLARLEDEGFFTLPPKLSKSAGATLGRKKSGTCKNWYISRPAPWQAGKAA